jgi:hypothetical protein
MLIEERFHNDNRQISVGGKLVEPPYATAVPRVELVFETFHVIHYSNSSNTAPSRGDNVLAVKKDGTPLWRIQPYWEPDFMIDPYCTVAYDPEKECLVLRTSDGDVALADLSNGKLIQRIAVNNRG